MEERTPKPMTPFDCMVTPTYLYTMKLMLPYTPTSMQRMLGIYIKFQELQHTMQYFYGFREDYPPSSMLERLKNFMEPSEREKMEQMMQMMNMMEMVQNLQSADALKGMFSAEQQEMFNMYSNIFDDALNRPESNRQKGDYSNE